jgi:hypothetical protein
MFGKSSKKEEAAPREGRRPSIKELQARTLDVWTSPAYSNTSATKKPRKGSFDAMRAARAAARSEAQGAGLVMRM